MSETKWHILGVGEFFFFFFYTSDNFCFCMWKQWKKFFLEIFHAWNQVGGVSVGKHFFWQIEEFLSCKTEFEKVWLKKKKKQS